MPFSTDQAVFLMLDHALSLVMGYLFGSVPFGLVLSHYGGAGDVRKIGSGNIGATNVLRTGHKGLAAATLLGDMLKATLAVAISYYYYGTNPAVIAGLGAFIGHNWPIWLKFKGGKGVATYIGALLGVAWPAALFFCAIWLTTALLFRISSLSALIASTLTPLFLIYQNHLFASLIFFFMTILTFWRHLANIKRLLRGEESKIGQK